MSEASTRGNGCTSAVVARNVSVPITSIVSTGRRSEADRRHHARGAP
ncbi:hypothetical protein [Natronococcus occultus]|nr:hypothetical protein [Natronococcus occultus]